MDDFLMMAFILFFILPLPWNPLWWHLYFDDEEDKNVDKRSETRR